MTQGLFPCKGVKILPYNQQGYTCFWLQQLLPLLVQLITPTGL